MIPLAKGQRLNILDIAPEGAFRVDLNIYGLFVDFSCFGLDAEGKLSDERYMTFFNQPKTPCGGVEICAVANDGADFSINLDKIPKFIHRIVVAASASGTETMSALAAGHLKIIENYSNHELARFSFTGADFIAEQALMLGELYRKDGGWRFMTVGQGFNGGLDALVKNFGGTVEEAPAQKTASISAPLIKISLEKRVASEAPKLINLFKQAGVSLDKVGLSNHRAKVCLCLDISGSMGGMYRKGLVQDFAERVLALACKFDDDGSIDVFLFGEQVHQPEPMDLNNWDGYINQVIARHPLEGDTRYGRAMKSIRSFYFPDTAGGARTTPLKDALPVYVMFITDGSTSDKAMTEKQLRWSSMEPIFWQFMGIGKGRKSKSKLLAAFSDSDFPFLESLEALSGRFIDNSNYFSVTSPDDNSDEMLYDLLMTEYPGWLKLATRYGLI